MKKVRIGAGSGFSGDRIEPAVELAERGGLRYLVFECLAERTIALAQLARRRDPEAGYDTLLAARMRAVLPACRRQGIRIVTNMGAANPLAAARRVAEVARGLGLSGLRIAAVTGDDVTDSLRGTDAALDEGGTVAALGNRLVSANAYIGAQPIMEALAAGAEVVVTGRVADPALFLGPLMHEFGWAADDWTRLGRGTVVGHLLECAGQVTGGYFADPGLKEVPDLARLGFPLAEVSEDGMATITKVPGSGGRVTAATVKEQLLYEVHDPARYLQPDVVADFSGVRIEPAGEDAVRVSGGDGTARTGTLKVSVGCHEGWFGEGGISYAGPGAAARGRLALEIVRERLRLIGHEAEELRFELIGVDSILGPAAGAPEPREVRVRVIGRCASPEEAERIGHEVDSLYLNGPASGGGVVKSVREVIGIRSCLIPEAEPRIGLTWVEA
ncbi:acyclic terpene utilization AtuA family protein [Muricoccus aerilatus]|uniref:acyclic terpene utilization AtuA family protein n=1 Tax=Muricoccus aerilatus TaxID=452982 RepID=UPI0005C135C0|nr:acyclic terpene utilization AtuA family protein [Roseomonas aerilata]